VSVPADWRARNRASWDERVAVHLAPGSGYDLAGLRRGDAKLDPIATAVLGPVAGCRLAHLQCHFGRDSLTLAQQGAEVTGLDFSGPAIAAARGLATELALPARFMQADLYDAPTALAAEQGGFDRVFVSWGALCWLPDMAGWARIVAGLLKPGGWLALAEAHPAAYVFDDAAGIHDGMPGWFAPYLARAALETDNTVDYANPTLPLRNSRTVEWLHPLADVIGGLLAAGLRLDRFEEHASVTWRMFSALAAAGKGGWHWPDRPWLPLSFSLRASRPESSE
jgi:SAM-dependent methyltransferase